MKKLTLMREEYGVVGRLAWPALVELILTQLCSMVDLMMVGRLGTWALAAVGLSAQPLMLLMSAFAALNVGATALVARFKGMEEQADANTVLRQTMLINLALGLLMTVLGTVGARWLIALMGAENEITLAAGATYLRIRLLGFPVLALTATITAALRGAGYTRQAMWYNLMANVFNVVGNYLLIEGNFGFPRMEVGGAALATVIGQAAAFVFSLSVLLRGKLYLSLRRRDSFWPDGGIIWRVVRIGLPAMLEQLVIRTGIMLFTRVVAGLGTVVFATHQTALNIQALSFMNGQAFGTAASALVGQNLGAQRPELAETYAKRARRLGLATSIAISALMFFFGGAIISLYTTDQSVIESGANVLKIMSVIIPFQNAQIIAASALRGAGDTMMTTVITFIGVLLFRPILAFVLVNQAGWGLYGAWIALGVDQILRSVLTFFRFRGGKWKTVKV